jgi:hypothetical protein
MPLSDMPQPGYAPPPTPESISPPMQVMGGFPLEEENPVSMQNGGLVEEASMLQQAGRNGDNMLVHMNPEEVGALNQMGNAGLGGLQQAQMTINPQTGLPEMFKFKDILPTIVGIGATMSGFGPVAAGLAAGGTSMATTKGDLGRSLMAGLGAWGGAELGNVLGGSGSLDMAGGKAATFGAGQTGLSATGAGAEAFGSKAIDAANLAGKDLIAMGGKDATQAAARDLAGRSLFQNAPAGVQFDAMKAGFGNVTPKWTATKAGEIGLSELAKPGLATVAGTMGSMPPPPIPEPEEPDPYEQPPPADYGYAGPPPEGYRPGIDPEYDYFRFANQGGYVNDLPTVNAKFGWKDAAGILSPAYMMHKADLGPLTGGIIPSLLSNKFRSDDDDQVVEPEGDAEAVQANFQGMTPEQQARTLMGGMGGGMGMNYQMEGGTRGDVVLPTVNAKFGLKDIGMAINPAYALARGGIKGMLSRFSPLYMLAKGRYGPEEEEPIDTEDIEEANAMMIPPQANVSGGQMYMQRGTKDKTVKGAMTDEEYLDSIEWEPPDEGMTADITTPLQRMTDAQLTSALQKEGVTREQIRNYTDPSLPIVSKREGGMAMGGGGVVGQLQQLGGQAQDFANSVQSTLGGGGGQSGLLGSLGTISVQREPFGPENVKPVPTTRSELDFSRAQEGQRGLSSFGSSLGSYLPFLFQTGSDGMVVDDAMSGVMSVASPEAQDALAERMAVPPAPNEPQNPEERAIYDSALLALQGMLEGEAAQMAIDEFIETFGAEAYRMLEQLVANESENGGIVQPANGETTVAEGEIQGPDVIPGKIVDPVTGEQTANLRVGENEYIEPADSLQRRAMAAGLPPSPQNGAMVRGEEEKQLEAMYG